MISIGRLDIPSEVVPPLSAEACFRVSNCFCFKTGRANMKSTLNQNPVDGTTPLVITSQIVNTDNKFRVKAVRYYLVQSIRLKATDFFVIPVSNIFHNDIEVHYNTDLRISAGQGAQEITHRFDLKRANWHSMPPIESQVVDCSYSVRVTLEFNNFCGCGNTSIIIPLEICNRKAVVENQYCPPPNINLEWNPIMISNIVIHTAEFNNVAINNSKKSNSRKDEAQVPDAETKKSTIQAPKVEDDTKFIENQV
jgi:hypothetical protein